MYCEMCKKNPATIHYTKVVNGLKEEKHLCEECAAKLKQNGEFNDFFAFDGKHKFGLLPDFSMADFIGGFFNPEGIAEGHNEGYVRQVKRDNACPFCGMTADEFRREGKVGCKECYNYFGDYMPSLLRRIHGSTVHNGKVPKKGHEELKMRRQIDDLRDKLKIAINEEDFEQAAVLRDQIRALEQTEQSKQANMRQNNSQSNDQGAKEE